MQNLFYAYQKLDTASSFRLLHIERPGPSDDAKAEWVYSLTQTTFDQAPPYETLSYVWGTSDRDELVKLRDGKLLRITKPLKDALAFVVRQCGTGHLWIDQICIDQDDRIERGNQVKIMGQIYSSCSRVLVWLGRITNFDAELSFKDDLGPVCPLQDTQVQKYSSMRHLITRLRKLTASGETSTRGGLHEMLQSQWFERAWVFQEIVLPTSALFIVATASTLPDQVFLMSLPELNAMIDRESMGLYIEDAVSDTIRIMYGRWFERHGTHGYDPSPIEQTLSLLAPRAKTSEDLDQLYAFFGLNLDTRINLTPSYDSSLELAMIDTATSIIEGTCSLDLFEVIPRAAEHTTGNNIRIPTWTPDFRKEHLVIPFRQSQSDLRQLTQSRPHLQPTFISSTYTYYRGTIYCAGEEKRTIHARGFVLDHVDIEIGTLSPRKVHETHLDALLKRSTKAWSRIESSVKNQSPPPSRDKHIPTTLIASNSDLGFVPVPDKGRLCRALAAEGCCAISDEYPRERLPELMPDSLRKMYPMEAMVHVMRGRTLWMTRSGRFVLGSHLRRGDHVCLVYGCTNPVALRSERDTCKVLGACFLEGWMDPWSTGKIVEAEEELQPTIFHIT
jgi:hypothetical protein